eukprot:CAMPEP_0185846416 /NCGR_PEP_ID=MMETSP1354-20130828/2062_1 /TAXON_ID=708628 /ORGANISM="Erythrolobus madagascarensis, Strain CCMP3276" /LENGTH=415 /DNA_ID=CAMNT_0028546547 /DNA_START=209 /DNA_END=1456 /DNA_ORIENTATION=+
MRVRISRPSGEEVRWSAYVVVVVVSLLFSLNAPSHATPLAVKPVYQANNASRASSRWPDQWADPWSDLVLVPETHPASGYGNQLQGLWNTMQVAACLGARFVLPPISYIKSEKRYKTLQLGERSSAYYDLDLIQEHAKLAHFASECTCFDFVVHPASHEKAFNLKTFKSKYDMQLFDGAEHVFIRQDGYSWNDFHRSKIDPSVGRSRCGNHRPCVHVQNTKQDNEIHFACGTAQTKEIQAAILPSQLLVRAASALLPPRVPFSRVLVVHVRDVAGEYNHFPDICASGNHVCIGRRDISSIPVGEFIAKVQAVAKQRGCSSIFPIFPKFSSDALRSRLSSGFLSNTDMLIPSRSDDIEFTLMVERTLAIYAKAFIGETQRTSFSSTLNTQRVAIGETPVIPMESLFPNAKFLGSFL